MYLYILVNYFQKISSNLFAVTVVILFSSTKMSLKALSLSYLSLSVVGNSYISTLHP